MDRFKETNWNRPRLDGVPFRNLRDEDRLELEKRFELQEIKEAIWECDWNKSPGPDGFNFNFFKKFWDVVKNDIWRMFNEFYDNGVLARGCNASFLALIPKVDSPLGLNDYRPISLVASIYKMISKVLAGRLKRVISRIIEENQSPFVGGRNLLDGVVIANEVLDEAKKKKKPLLSF